MKFGGQVVSDTLKNGPVSQGSAPNGDLRAQLPAVGRVVLGHPDILWEEFLEVPSPSQGLSCYGQALVKVVDPAHAGPSVTVAYEAKDLAVWVRSLSRWGNSMGRGLTKAALNKLRDPRMGFQQQCLQFLELKHDGFFSLHHAAMTEVPANRAKLMNIVNSDNTVMNNGILVGSDGDFVSTNVPT